MGGWAVFRLMILPNIGFFTLPTRFRLPTFQPCETHNRYYSQYVKKTRGGTSRHRIECNFDKIPNWRSGCFQSRVRLFIQRSASQHTHHPMQCVARSIAQGTDPCPGVVIQKPHPGTKNHPKKEHWRGGHGLGMRIHARSEVPHRISSHTVRNSGKQRDFKNSAVIQKKLPHDAIKQGHPATRSRNYKKNQQERLNMFENHLFSELLDGYSSRGRPINH